MEIYVVIVSDKHAEPEAYVFDTAQVAIDYAKDQAFSMAYDPSEVDETPVGEWLYHADYAEDSSVWVVKKSMNSTN